MSRFKSNLYTVERRVWRNHKLCWIQNDDFTLFSGHHKTKIKEEDLPEWYVFGRYYKLWGFLSTKGITDLQYIPNLWINHFLKDDCLLISYSGKIEEHPDSIGFEKYSGVDERVWGNEILHVLKGARMFSQYDIAPIIEQIREKQRILIENYPDEFDPTSGVLISINGWQKSTTQAAQPITAKPSQKREKQSCENYMTKEDRQMDECQHAMEELRNIVEGISKLRDTAYAHYSLLVERVLKDQITDEQQLEQIMDGLCDFCDEIRFIDLYRSLCRHIYYQYPQLVGEHVALFRALFEGPDEK